MRAAAGTLAPSRPRPRGRQTSAPLGAHPTPTDRPPTHKHENARHGVARGGGAAGKRVSSSLLTPPKPTPAPPTPSTACLPLPPRFRAKVARERWVARLLLLEGVIERARLGVLLHVVVLDELFGAVAPHGPGLSTARGEWGSGVTPSNTRAKQNGASSDSRHAMFGRTKSSLLFSCGLTFRKLLRRSRAADFPG